MLAKLSKIYVVLCVSAVSAVATIEPGNIVNPGAETGDLTGWSTYNNRFISTNDTSNAFEGDFYFFSQASRTANNGVSFSQTVDLSEFTGRIVDVRASSAFRYETGQRWGYDSQTDTNYLYDWQGFFQVNAHSDEGHLFGIGFSLSPSNDWQIVTIPLSLKSDWESTRNELSEISIQPSVMFYPVNSEDPSSSGIESWGNWVGSEPTFIGFDSIAVEVELNNASTTNSVAVDILPAIALQWQTVTGETYQVQACTSLVTSNWFNIGDSIIGNGLTNFHYEVANHSNQYYRIQLIE